MVMICCSHGAALGILKMNKNTNNKRRKKKKVYLVVSPNNKASAVRSNSWNPMAYLSFFQFFTSLFVLFYSFLIYVLFFLQKKKKKNVYFSIILPSSSFFFMKLWDTCRAAKWGRVTRARGTHLASFHSHSTFPNKYYSNLLFIIIHFYSFFYLLLLLVIFIDCLLMIINDYLMLSIFVNSASRDFNCEATQVLLISKIIKTLKNN